MPWYITTRNFKLMYLFIQLKTYNHFQMTASGLLNVSLQTFVAVMSNDYLLYHTISFPFLDVTNVCFVLYSITASFCRIICSLLAQMLRKHILQVSTCYKLIVGNYILIKIYLNHQQYFARLANVLNFTQCNLE